ncbi:hypothetical protein EMCG_05078 [[Emmonsia] crescens]|uniref:Uncharacterized protein n=1 Tax=[Emmonsia] crescens TaxID=73230 RepID=A0A0G2J6M4_9EURO|nr:hypothetical protein EMCG_05078 [Emmonsia crescens UAMH 3008]
MAKYVSSTLIKMVTQGTKTLAVEYVDRTTTWYRTDFGISEACKTEFTAVVQENMDKFKPETAKVAMKESEHQSEADMRKHFTAYELDKEGTVIAVKHLVKKLK